jgi:hypothetical protein
MMVDKLVQNLAGLRVELWVALMAALLADKKVVHWAGQMVGC